MEFLEEFLVELQEDFLVAFLEESLVEFLVEKFLAGFVEECLLEFIYWIDSILSNNTRPAELVQTSKIYYTSFENPTNLRFGPPQRNTTRRQSRFQLLHI